MIFSLNIKTWMLSFIRWRIRELESERVMLRSLLQTPGYHWSDLDQWELQKIGSAIEFYRRMFDRIKGNKTKKARE